MSLRPVPHPPPRSLRFTTGSKLSTSKPTSGLSSSSHALTLTSTILVTPSTCTLSYQRGDIAEQRVQSRLRHPHPQTKPHARSLTAIPSSSSSPAARAPPPRALPPWRRAARNVSGLAQQIAQSRNMTSGTGLHRTGQRTWAWPSGSPAEVGGIVGRVVGRARRRMQ